MTERIVKAGNSFKFPAVDVVEASAGSGKTYALAKRYVQLILNPNLKTENIPIKSILAVTFTNKASMEMKQRILEFLKMIAFDTFPNPSQRENILSSLAVNPAAAKKLAYETMDEIIDNYNFFQVQTIDSFINTLLKGCAFYLDLAFDFRIKQNQHKYLVHSIDCLIDKMGDLKIRNAFEEFLNYYLFVENKEAWFSKRNIVELIEILYNYSNTYGGRFRKPDVEVKEIIEKKKAIIGLIEEMQRNAPEETDKRFIGSITKFLDKNKDSFAIENISAYFAREEFPLNKGAEAGEKIVKLWTDIRKSLEELCEWESSAVFAPYIEIFNLAIAEFRELARIDDVVFLSELNVYAWRLFEDNAVTVSEIYYRIATRLHHYLIDEFQDTSKLQWRNIFPLVEEALSSGGSLFYVGDKKQAIFRFRGGEVSLFDSVQDDFTKFNLTRSVLAKNYRSQKEIVEFNNEIFSEDNLKRFIQEENVQDKDNFEFSDEDVKKVLSIFRDSKEEPKEKNKYGYVKVEAVETPSVDESNLIIGEKVISLIKELKQRFGYGDIAILARKNNDVKLFTSWLIEEGIPVESERTVSIREHALIKELISFLKFLNSPIDNLSFASFILGDIFQEASGIKQNVVRDFLFKHRLRSKEQKGPYLYREFRNKFPYVWNNLIDELFKNVGFAPLYEFMVSIFNKFKVIENFPGQQGFLMRLLEFIKEKEDDYSGLSSFLEFFEEIEEKELFVNLTRSDSVRIMTIHKSKGLEFPVVILPFLEIDVGVGSGTAGARKPYVVRQSDKDNNLRLIQFKKGYGLFSENLKIEYKEEYIKSLIDELNSLYVALTRAMQELYIFIPSKISNKRNLACSLVPYKGHERGSKREYRAVRAKEERILPVSKYSDWLEILKDEFISPLQLLRRDNLLKGNIIHFLLSCIGNLAADDKDKSLRIAGEKAESVFSHEKNLGKYISIVRNLLEDEKFRQFFYIKDGSIYQEKEVVDSCGNRKVIDRLIVMPKEVWIVDYKSSRDGFGAQKEQMLEYMEIVKSLYLKLKIKGFLVYPDSLTIEEIQWKE